MPRYTYTVHVDASSQAQADIVMIERLNYDERYDGPDGNPFDYRISLGPAPTTDNTKEK